MIKRTRSCDTLLEVIAPELKPVNDVSLIGLLWMAGVDWYHPLQAIPDPPGAEANRMEAL